MSNQGEENLRISLEQNYEIRYWTKKLCCTRQQLYRAVQKVGACAKAVRKELMR